MCFGELSEPKAGGGHEEHDEAAECIERNEALGGRHEGKTLRDEQAFLSAMDENKKPPESPRLGRLMRQLNVRGILFLHPAHGFHEKFASRVETEFLADVCLMSVHRFGTEFELFSDLM